MQEDPATPAANPDDDLHLTTLKGGHGLLFRLNEINTLLLKVRQELLVGQEHQARLTLEAVISAVKELTDWTVTHHPGYWRHEGWQLGDPLPVPEGVTEPDLPSHDNDSDGG